MFKEERTTRNVYVHERMAIMASGKSRFVLTFEIFQIDIKMKKCRPIAKVLP